MDDSMNRIVPQDSGASSDDEEDTPLIKTMRGAGIGVSSQTLVSRTKAAKFPQYIAALSATLGGFVMGSILGWTSPAQLPLKNGTEYFYVTDAEFALIGGLASIGAMVGSLVTGPISDMIGRRTTMISLIVPCVVGWAIIIWAQNVRMMLAGRFILGLAVGSTTVVCPLYTTEIAEVDVRGTLGTYFQLQVTLGILYAYIFGAANVSVYWLSVACFIIPFIFCFMMIWVPESPQYYLKKNNKQEASKSLQWLRGKNYEITGEITAMVNDIDQMRENKVSFLKAFTSTAAKKGLIIGLGIMFFQQFSGINAVVFYSSRIFSDAGSTLDPNICTLIVGAVMFVATFVSSLVIDRLGRKPLLLVSIIVMAIAAAVLGGFFYMKNNEDISQISWLPIICMCVFIILFSLGFGPIPWMFMGEIFPAEIKGPAVSIASLFNWLCVFIITSAFSAVVDGIGIDYTFWIFTVLSAIGAVFVFLLVPETKGKTLDEIQRELGGGSSNSKQNKSDLETGGSSSKY